MFHSSLAISGEFLNRKQQRPTLDRPAIKSRTSWVHLSPVLPIPGGLHNRLSCPSIRPHSSEGKLAGKLDTGSLCVSRLLRGGETRVKFRPLFPNVEEWPLIVPHPCVACCCGGQSKPNHVFLHSFSILHWFSNSSITLTLRK